MSVHNGLVKPTAMACRYCGLSPTYCACDRFLDARACLPISTSSSPEGRAKPGMAGTLLPEKAVAILRECAPAGIKPGLDVDSFELNAFELFQTRNARQGPREFYAEPFALAGRTTAARSRVSRARKRTGGCFL